MKNIKIYITSLLVGTLFCTIYYFIKVNNDHIECETIISTKVDKNGNEMVKKSHLCKEKYAF